MPARKQQQTREQHDEAAAPAEEGRKRATQRQRAAADTQRTSPEAEPNKDAGSSSGGDDTGDIGDTPSGGSSTNKRHVRSPLQRVDLLISMLSAARTSKVILTELIHLCKQLDGADIKTKKRSRPANAYNLFMKEKMNELGALHEDKKSAEVFAMCIQLWRAQKGGGCCSETDADAAPDAANAAEPAEAADAAVQ